MDDIRRRRPTISRPDLNRQIVVPNRKTITEVVQGKAFIAPGSPKAVVEKAVEAAPAVSLNSFAGATQGVSLAWKPNISVAPISQHMRLPANGSLFKKILLWVCTLAVLSLSVFVSLDALLTTNRAKEYFSQETTPPTSNDQPATPAVDESKPPTNWISGYKVAADLPKVIRIPGAKVEARVVGVGTTSEGAMVAPKNIYDAGWYESSSKPGQGGAVLVDGHATGPTATGVFGGINKLKQGDKITIERGDGKTLTYSVNKVAKMPVGQVNMSELMLPYQAGTNGLNLITCAGEYDAKSNTYPDRVLVFATQV